MESRNKRILETFCLATDAGKLFPQVRNISPVGTMSWSIDVLVCKQSSLPSLSITFTGQFIGDAAMWLLVNIVAAFDKYSATREEWKTVIPPDELEDTAVWWAFRFVCDGQSAEWLSSYPKPFECIITPRSKLAESLVRDARFNTKDWDPIQTDLPCWDVPSFIFSLLRSLLIDEGRFLMSIRGYSMLCVGILLGNTIMCERSICTGCEEQSSTNPVWSPGQVSSLLLLQLLLYKMHSTPTVSRCWCSVPSSCRSVFEPWLPQYAGSVPDEPR